MEQRIKDIVGKYLFKPNVKETIDDMTKEIQKYVNSLNYIVGEVKVNKDNGTINVNLKKWFDTLYKGEDKVAESDELDSENGDVKIKPIKTSDSLKLDFDSIFKDFDEMFKDFGLSENHDEDFIQLNPTNEILVNKIGEYIDLDYLETEENDSYKTLKCGVNRLFEFEIIERKDRSVYFIREGDEKGSMYHSPEDALKSLEKFFEYTNQSEDSLEKMPELDSDLNYVISKASQNGWKYEQNVTPLTGPKNVKWKHVFTKENKCWYSNDEHIIWFPYEKCSDSKTIHTLGELLLNLVKKDDEKEIIINPEYKMSEELAKAGFIKNGKFLSKNGISVQQVIDAGGIYYLYDEVKIQNSKECARMLIQASLAAEIFKKIYSM